MFKFIIFSIVVLTSNAYAGVDGGGKFKLLSQLRLVAGVEGGEKWSNSQNPANITQLTELEQNIVFEAVLNSAKVLSNGDTHLESTLVNSFDINLVVELLRLNNRSNILVDDSKIVELAVGLSFLRSTNAVKTTSALNHFYQSRSLLGEETTSLSDIMNANNVDGAWL